MFADLIRSVSFINISVDIYQRPSNLNFLNITFEYCSAYSNLSPIVQLGIEGMKNFAKDLFHRCPYLPKKRIGVENLPMAFGLPFISLMNIPRGDYKTVFSIRDQNNELIFNVQLLGTIAQKRGPKMT